MQGIKALSKSHTVRTTDALNATRMGRISSYKSCWPSVKTEEQQQTA